MWLKHINIQKNMVVPTVVDMFFNFLIFLFVPILSIYFKANGVSDQMLGVVFSFFPLMLIFFAPIVGILSDHIGRKRIIYFGVMAQLAVVLIYIVWPTVPGIILARIISGFAWAAVALITLAKVEDKVKESERGAKSGLFLSITYIGMILGPLVGSFLADKYSLRFPFIISAIGLAIMLIWLTLWKSHHKPVIKKRDFNPLEAIKKFWSVKKLRAMAWLGIARHTTTPVFKIFLPLLILEMGFGYKEIGFVFFLQGLAHLLQFFAGKLSDKKGSANVLVVSVIFSSVLIIIAGLTRQYVLLVIVLLLEAIFSAFWNTSAWTFMSEIGEKKKMEGVVVGSYLSLAKTGHFLFAVASGFLAVAFGISSLFVIVGVIGLIAIIGVAPVLLKKEEVIG